MNDYLLYFVFLLVSLNWIQVDFLNFGLKNTEECALSKRFCANFAYIGEKHVSHAPTSGYMVYKIHGSHYNMPYNILLLLT